MENFVKLQHEFFNIYMYKQTADTIGLHFFLQLIDVISSLTPVTTAVPLIGVLALSAVKDAYDDIVSVIIVSRIFLVEKIFLFVKIFRENMTTQIHFFLNIYIGWWR